MTPDQFLTTVHEHRPKLKRIAYNVLKNVEDSEDAVQNAIVIMAGKLDTFNPERPVLPWAARFTHWAAKNMAKRHHRRHIGVQQLKEHQIPRETHEDLLILLIDTGIM